MSDVVKTYIKYKQKRAEIKARQKRELDAELEPYLKDFGEAVNDAQAKGKTIVEVEFEIGAKNRNLVYTAKRLAKGFKVEPKPKTPDTPTEAADEAPEARLEVRTVYGGFDVYIDAEYKGHIDTSDPLFSPIIPEEWALDTENQALYREAIKQIREAVDGSA